MFTPLPGHILSSGQEDVRAKVSLPMVYEKVPVEPAHWEYRVITLDVREEAVLEEARLNELGNEGWLLTNILEQHINERSALIHYYFVREK